MRPCRIFALQSSLKAGGRPELDRASSPHAVLSMNLSTTALIATFTNTGNSKSRRKGQLSPWAVGPNNSERMGYTVKGYTVKEYTVKYPIREPRLAIHPDWRRGSRATASLGIVQSGAGKRRIPLREGLFGQQNTFAYRVLNFT
jgi:hypothetical protein